MTSCWPSGPPAIGTTAELSRTIGPDDIERFTDISGDRNPLHYDLAAAEASRFGEIVVQGGITSAILNAVVAECLSRPGDRLPERELGLQSTRPSRRCHYRPRGDRRSQDRQASHQAPHHRDPR